MKNLIKKLLIFVYLMKKSNHLKKNKLTHMSFFASIKSYNSNEKNT